MAWQIKAVWQILSGRPLVYGCKLLQETDGETTQIILDDTRPTILIANCEFRYKIRGIKCSGNQ